MRDLRTLTRLRNVGESLALVFLAIAVCVAVVIRKVCGSVARLWDLRKDRPKQNDAMDEYVRSLHEARTKRTPADRAGHRLEKRHESSRHPKRSANEENAPTPHCPAEDAHSRD
ncbi:hypothetical protein [Paraburkholderia xenovorans]|uniref:hypothetical protein n=1 Tax=Paraburkholderia xenovorans TaxID=36873 RepID=UPI000325CF20|nr:hypothetical protein [Paraburkholderia xenovorans]